MPLVRHHDRSAGELTVEQVRKLEQIVRKDRAARVIGWHDSVGGPLLRRGDGAWHVLRPDGSLDVLARGDADDDAA